MTDEVIPLRRCRRCTAASVPADVVSGDTVTATLAMLCEVHLTEAKAEADANRVVFDGLLNLGLSREAANVMMVAMFDHHRAGGQ